MTSTRDTRDHEAVDLDELFPGDDQAATLARGTSWSGTPLGSPDGWAPDLTAAIRTVMPSRVPMLLWWGPELVQIYNEAYRPLLGSKHPTAMGQPAAECWAEVWDELGPMTRRVVEAGESTYAHDLLLFLERHGYVEETYWTFSYSPVRSPRGDVTGIFVATSDVTTARVEAHRLGALIELASLSSADFASAEAMAGGVEAALSRHRGAVPYATLHLPDGTGGLTRHAAYGMDPSSAALPAHLASDADHPVTRVLGTGEPRLVTFGAHDLAADEVPVGPERPTQGIVVPLGAPDRRVAAVAVLGVNPYRHVDEGYLSFASLVGRQLSALLLEVRAAADERERVAAIAALDASRRTFFANVSHELRTPVTVALMAARELRTGPLSAEQAAHVDAVERAGRRLDRLVGTLLDFARAEAGALVPELAPVDLVELTLDVVGMFRSAVEAAGLSLDVDVDVAGAPSVVTDREAWATILGNLLTNAYKFTGAGGIRVRLHRRDGEVTLVVTDTGVGIEPDAAQRVFERFVQVVGRPVRGVPGAGIGLALVRELVGSQGGSVTLESSPGTGTAVTVVLPVSVAEETGTGPERSRVEAIVAGVLDHPAPGDDVRPVPDESRDHDAVLDGRDGERPLALLVEDHADLRRYLGRLLTSDGWEVVAVGDVAGALALDRTPDLVLCDVMLPGPSGVDLVTVLRDGGRWSTVPIVLLTARAGSGDVAEGLRAGADDYVRKPFEPVELLARLRTHHELSRDRQRRLREVEDQAANLEIALDRNRRIGIAVGVLMSAGRITSEQAFDQLRTHSQNTNRKLYDVAEDVVLTGELPTGG